MNKLKRFTLILWAISVAVVLVIVLVLPVDDINVKIPGIATLLSLITTSLVSVALLKKDETK